MNQFNRDLKDGKIAEDLLSIALLDYGITGVTYNKSKSVKQLKKYDLMYYNRNGNIPIKIEVKNDIYSIYSNKFAIECRYKDEPSGIETTEANYYALLKQHTFYIIKTSLLRELINSNKYRCIECNGGETFSYLIDCNDIANEGLNVDISKYLN